MSVTFAPELAEAIEVSAERDQGACGARSRSPRSEIKVSAERQGLSADDWIVAAAELKFRADDEAEAFEEAERKRRLALWHEYMEESQAEFGAFTQEEMTEEEMAEAAKRRQEAHRRAEEYRARNGLYTSDLGDLHKLCEATGFSRPW